MPRYGGRGSSEDDGHEPSRSQKRWWTGSPMSFIWWVICAIVWVAIAFWPARVAGRKGHSFIGFFIFSLIFFPLALIVAYLSGDRRVAVG
jgi:hypothetical protein